MPSRRKTLLVLTALLAYAVLAGPAHAATFNVNTTVDQGDSNLQDPACDFNSDQAGDQCTLRAAIQQINALNDTAPTHTVNVPVGTYSLTAGALNTTYNVNVVGAGARSTIIERSLEAAPARVFVIDNFTVNISGVTIRNGIANANNGSFGGNVLAELANVTITNSTVASGRGDSGGGLSNQSGTLTLRNSTISDNQAATGGGDGGAIQNGNTAGPVQVASALVLENTTLARNAARLGGGIISGGNAGNSVTVRNSTIAGNTSSLTPNRGGGGGLLIGTGTAAVQNSIVALNTSVSVGQENCSKDLGATITSSGSNIESGTECGFTATGDRQGVDPRLGPLQNAGGPTDTRPLLAGSPALDAGNTATCLATDQRGIARPQGLVCDIGAYEAVIAPDTVIVTAPQAITEDRTPTFTFSSTQPGTSFECSLDNAPFLPCTSPFSVPELPAGAHTFQVRAKDLAGNADPTPASFTFVIPAKLSDLDPPVLGKTVNADPVSGTVLVAVPAKASRRGGAKAAQKGLTFVPLQEARQVPIGSFFNTRKGRVRLQSATSRRGKRQAGVFTGGLFQTRQSRRKSANAVFELRLKGSSFRNCKVSSRGQAGASRRSRRRIRRLSGNAKGRFRTRGRYSAATVRGTRWGVTDRCDGTLTKVSSGRVAVRDFRRRKNVLVRRGKSYLARAPG